MSPLKDVQVNSIQFNIGALGLTLNFVRKSKRAVKLLL